MTNNERIIKQLMDNASKRCAERIQAVKTIAHKPCEEFGITSVLKKKRGL